MRKEQLPLYAIAAAILVVGLAYAGVSLTTVLPLFVFLACPLMMFFMMRNMDDMGHDGHHDETPRFDSSRTHDTTR